MLMCFLPDVNSISAERLLHCSAQASWVCRVMSQICCCQLSQFKASCQCLLVTLDRNFRQKLSGLKQKLLVQPLFFLF